MNSVRDQCDWWTCVALHVVSAQAGCCSGDCAWVITAASAGWLHKNKRVESFHSQLVTILFDLGARICRLKLRTGEKILVHVPGVK